MGTIKATDILHLRSHTVTSLAVTFLCQAEIISNLFKQFPNVIRLRINGEVAGEDLGGTTRLMMPKVRCERFVACGGQSNDELRP